MAMTTTLAAVTAIDEHISNAVAIFHKIPGSTVLVRYVRSSHQNDPIRSVIEFSLFLLAIYYLWAPAYSPRKQAGNYVALTEDEIDELIDDWTPEPLVTNEATGLPFEPPMLQRDTAVGAKTRLADGRNVLNLASWNHHNLSQDQSLIDNAVDTIRTYGVGPCSAPNFAGTFDVHLDLENTIASHFGTEGAIVYSQSFITISSVIPCFCKRGDNIVADRAVNYAIRRGIQASRSAVHWYDHNDMDDLERVLAKIVSEQRPLTRRFIITEGLFENVGDMPNIPKLIELKSKYKFRLFLDETWSYGVLGRTGRGVTELQNVDACLVDGIVGSLAGGIAAGGGFCTGSTQLIEHQRLNSAAVTFSASLPTFLATSASKVIAKLQSPEGRKKIASLHENVGALRLQLTKSEWVQCCSAAESPVVFLVLKEQHVTRRKLSRFDEEALLQDIVNECISSHSILVTRSRFMPSPEGAEAKYLAQEWQPRPALKVCATSGLSQKEMTKAGTAVRHAIAVVMK